MLRGLVATVSALLALAPQVARADDGEGFRLGPKGKNGIEITSAANPPRFVSIDPPAPPQVAPFLLPDLAHPRTDLHLDQIFGWLTPSPAIAGRTSSFAAIVRPSFEANIRNRKLYLGFTYPIGMALPPDGGLVPGEAGRPGGMHTVIGNVEAHVRANFSLPMNLETGFVLGVVAPTATFDRTARSNVSIGSAIGSLDPTNSVHFEPGRVALRPAADVRIRRGILTVQVRHGLDIIIDDDGIESARIAGRLLGHVGVLVRPDLELSLEASQIYYFASDQARASTAPADVFANTYRITDAHRAAFNYGPALRYATRALDIGGALVVSAGDPLSPVTDRLIGFRLSFAAHVGRAR